MGGQVHLIRKDVGRQRRPRVPAIAQTKAQIRCHQNDPYVLWLLLDKAPCHIAAGSLAVAAALNMRLLWLPRQCSELKAMDHLWRQLKDDLAANRQRPTIDALAEQAEAWVLALTDQQALRKAGLLSKNCWLKNVRTDFCTPT